MTGTALDISASAEHEQAEHKEINPIHKPVIAAVPAYNVARVIGSVVVQCRRHTDALLVLSDGLYHTAAAIAKAAGVMERCHELHSGRENKAGC